MGLLRALIRYLATPVFLGLALVSRLLDMASGDSMAAMMGMGPPQPVAILPGVVLPPEVASALQSMWLMYLLMGVFHSGAWFDLLRPHRRRSPAMLQLDAAQP